VIEIDESPEAPHAIENQKRVYVRTGNAANPYDLAEVDLIIERFTRRNALQKRRLELVERQEERSTQLTFETTQQMQVAVRIGPQFPRRAIVDREAVWAFGYTQLYRGGRFIPSASIRRTNDGIAGAWTAGRDYADITQFGFVFWKTTMQLQQATRNDTTTNHWKFFDPFATVLKALVCASRYYKAIRFQGAVEIEVRLTNCFRQSLPFLAGGENHFGFDAFRSLESTITASEITSVESLDLQLGPLITRLLIQVCWSFWQSEESFPEVELAKEIGQMVSGMRPF